MDIETLRKKSESELQKMLKAERETRRDLSFRIASKQHKDVRELRESKRTIARILTVLKEKDFLKQVQQGTAAAPTAKKTNTK